MENKIIYKVVIELRGDKIYPFTIISTPSHYFDNSEKAEEYVREFINTFYAKDSHVKSTKNGYSISDNEYEFMHIFIRKIYHNSIYSNIDKVIFKNKAKWLKYREFDIIKYRDFFYVKMLNETICFKKSIESCIDFIDTYNLNHRMLEDSICQN